MNKEDFFNGSIQEEVIVDSNDFFKKTKSLLEKIANIHSASYKSNLLKEDEYPDESVCDKCRGCGTFGEDKECFQNREYGECFYTECDYEEIGVEIEPLMGDIYDLLRIDKIEVKNK